MSFGWGLYHYRRALWATMASLLCAAAAQAEETVVLQLKWRHAFQFAGYYAAIEKVITKRRG